MTTVEHADAAAPPASPGPSMVRRAVVSVLTVLLLYFAAAYIVAPAGWKRYARRHPEWANAPRITRTRSSIPGDPLNLALVGSEEDVERNMVAAGWYPADDLTLGSCLKIASASVLKRPYDDAPVSNLYLFGRKQDLAFEQPVNDNPRKRHHVRFWKWNRLGPEGRPVWFGSGTYDERVGFSYTTGQITHHIDGDIDVERDHIVGTLTASSEVEKVYTVDGFHEKTQGRNGGGDLWHTDGDLRVVVLRVSKGGNK
jgi:hypothetical protein